MPKPKARHDLASGTYMRYVQDPTWDMFGGQSRPPATLSKDYDGKIQQAIRSGGSGGNSIEIGIGVSRVWLYLRHPPFVCCLFCATNWIYPRTISLCICANDDQLIFIFTLTNSLSADFWLLSSRPLSLFRPICSRRQVHRTDKLLVTTQCQPSTIASI